MLWGYAMPKRGEEHWKVMWRRSETLKAGPSQNDQSENEVTAVPSLASRSTVNGEAMVDRTESTEEIQEGEKSQHQVINDPDNTDLEKASQAEDEEEPAISPLIQPAKAQLYSELSIVLTIISILVAFAISIIEFMGIALEKCAVCAAAAANSSGLDGKWWRFWQACNDSSGYIGAGIVGVMLLCGAIYIGLRRYRRKQAAKLEVMSRQDANARVR